MRTCGTCTLCCKVLGVHELEKPGGVDCPHVKPLQGCGIYADRPQSCRAFECLWLQGEGRIPETLKPERTHVVLSATVDGEMIVAHVDADYPNADTLIRRGAMGRYIEALVKKGVVVFAVIGEERRMYYRGSKVPPHILERINTLKAKQEDMQ